jgi:hypothetical protein
MVVLASYLVSYHPVAFISRRAFVDGACLPESRANAILNNVAKAPGETF